MKKDFYALAFVMPVITILIFLSFSRPCPALSGYTATMKDQMQQELSNKDGALRKKTLMDYLFSVNEKNEVSLRDFHGGDDAAARAIEGKASLVLHQLRTVIGKDAFSVLTNTLETRPSTTAEPWERIKILSERETGLDLAWFFEQWVDRKGVPELRMENAAVRRSGSMFEVSFDILQNGDAYILDVPVQISFLNGGNEAEMVHVDSSKKHVTILVADEPSMIAIDRDYDIPRKLTDAEIPPLLIAFLKDEKPLLILPVSDEIRYESIIEYWKKKGIEVKKVSTISDQDLKTASFLVLGFDNPVISRLYGKIDGGEGVLTVQVRKNPWNPKKIVAAIEVKTDAAADEFIHHYAETGAYSFLTLDATGRIAQHTTESEMGISMILRKDPLAVEVAALRTLSRVIDDSAGKKIVYVGEYHDRFAHHNIELEIIKSLYRKNAEIAIGMEMFQRPFQSVLDDYIGGILEEREFLKKTEYFSRWGYDYNLYKPILDFARAWKIPVVALNLRREITDKVSQNGMDSLNEDEKKEIPEQTNFSDDSYRERLLRVFAEHKDSSERNFDFFYQAQVLWDETMSRSIDEYLKKNPGRQMIVIAGQGHFIYGSGIPRRTFRRNGYIFTTILNDVDVGRDIADYVLFPEPMDGVTAPKLGVFLKEGDGKVLITDMTDGSVAREAGLKPGDRILALDNVPVQTSDDIRIALFYKKPDDTIAVTIIRHRFLFGDRKMIFQIKLQ